MKRAVIHLLFVALILTFSCQKAPELALSSPTSIDVSANGGTTTITFSANRDWTASSSESWVTVSPSSGAVSEDGTAKVKVSCTANTTYEARSATITITVEDLTQKVTVSQPANLGLIVPDKLFELTGSGTITVEVQSNVDYVVSISDDWITQVGAKGLVTDELTFAVDDNDTYDTRSATITIKAREGNVLEQVVVVKQAQKDAILIGNTSYDMPYGGGEIQVKIQANVNFDVKSEANWIHYVETKALSNSTVSLTIDKNGTYNERKGKVRISQRNGSLSYVITVKQAGSVAVTSVSLDKSTLTLDTGTTETLVATVKPDNASDKSVTWSSNNTSVATVSSSGVVTAIKAGSATITVKTNDGGETATCSVTVKAASSGQEAVELGLPSGIKWASCNIGASSPEDYGDYYAWGETETKSDYSWSTYKWCNGSYNSLTKYNTSSSYGTVDNKTMLENSDDVARVKLGGNWRMPTDAEWTELRTKCSWTWTTQNGVYGRKVTGPNGRSIFLPAAGCRYDTSLGNAGSYGNYWSSSLDTGYPYYAWLVYFGSDGVYRSYYDRYSGRSVRPVLVPVYGDVVSVTSVSLNMTSLSLTVGATQTLTAAVSPSNATDKSVTWASNNTSVATVSSSGVVTAIKAGSATITVKTNDGGKTATCSVTVTNADNVPEAVDLGLSVKWASFNIGASKPEDYGDYYAWGETGTKSNYDWSTYKWCNGSYNSLTKYNNTSSLYGTVDNKTKLENSDDVARVKLGGKWRMPTDTEWTELRTNCSWTWTTQNGVYGRKVIGPNGNSIFLPAAGGRYGASLDYAVSYGFYWSSSLNSDYSNYAWGVYFSSGGVYRHDDGRNSGQSVRPVSE